MQEFEKELFHQDLRSETIKGYIGIIKDFLAHYSEATDENAKAFLDWKADKGLSGAYRTLCHYALQAYFRFIKKDSEFKFPFKLPRKLEHIQPTFSAQQIEKMLKIAKGNLQDYLILRVLFATGVRRSELVGIEKRDLIQDGDNFFLRVRKPKGREERDVPIDDMTARIIQRLPGKGKLFGIQPREVTAIVNCYAGKVNARQPRSGSHSIRRSFASSLHREGVDVITLKNLMGHRRLAQTEKYISIPREELAKVIREKHPLARKEK